MLTTGVVPSIHVEYKHSKIKQYFKMGRAIRAETTINDTRDFGLGRGLLRFDHPLTQALLTALVVFRANPDGFSNRELRHTIAPLLGVTPASMTPGAMTYTCAGCAATT